MPLMVDDEPAASKQVLDDGEVVPLVSSAQDDIVSRKTRGGIVRTDEPLIPKHGGYRKLKSFQLAQLVYDITVRFCERFVDPRSRTRDQMVQAARSGVQNIAEGSQASGTSKKTELKLTNVARASLEELRLDYEDFLRQRGFPLLPQDHPALVRFKARRCTTVEEVRLWVEDEQGRTRTKTRTNRDEKGEAGAVSVSVRGGPCSSLSSSTLVANAALSLLNLGCHLLDRQLEAQARAFENEGGFTERLYRIRSKRRGRS
jgi:four helix bundle suffix protein